ncbi:hypothetical protein GCM10029964_095620 [Kibdelosporangium lantanae]
MAIRRPAAGGEFHQVLGQFRCVDDDRPVAQQLRLREDRGVDGAVLRVRRGEEVGLIGGFHDEVGVDPTNQGVGLGLAGRGRAEGCPDVAECQQRVLRSHGGERSRG